MSHPVQELRYEIGGDQHVAVTIDPDDLRHGRRTLDARLINLSGGGARFSVPWAIPQGETLRVQLAIESLGLSMYVTAEVCWTAEDGSGNSILGCRVQPAVPAGIIAQLAQGGRLDRREVRRRPAACEVAIKRPMSSWWSSAQTGALRNVAGGGLCLETRKAVKLGEPFHIAPAESALEIEVMPRWQLQEGKSYLVGCEFVDARRAAEFEASLAAYSTGA